MFLKNKYAKIYFSLMEKVKSENRLKEANDGNQYHHIIPKSLGGSDDNDNLILLTYREHKLAHRLLIEMTTEQNRIKMSYAYSWFGSSAGNYKTGKDNNFAKPEIIELVRERMINNNPMKDPKQRERMKQTNHRNRAIITPDGQFVSRAAALRHHGFKHWKVLYDLMEEYPDQYYWVKTQEQIAAAT